MSNKHVPGKQHSWVGFTTLYTALLLIPIVLYVFIYQGSRIDDATIRNFRSLEAAAKRVEAVLETMRKVSRNYSLGLDLKLLGHIAESCDDLKQPASSLREFIVQNRRPSKISLNLESVFVGDLSKLSECGANSMNFDVSRYRKLERSCEDRTIFRSGKLVNTDCRTLQEKHKLLYDALKKSNSEALSKLLDQFGIEVSMATSAFDGPTRHLSMFFDSYFIANSKGEVLFARNNTSSSNLDEYGRTSVPFASFAEVAHLLLEQADEPIDAQGFLTEAGPSAKTGATPVGHSTVRTVKVDDVTLSVFIHPLPIDMSSATALPKSATTTEHVVVSPAEVRGNASYIVGVVRQSALAKEAIRLRLGPAVDATLMIAMLLALLPILRFWATGDRSISGRFNLYGIGASAVAATAFGTALLFGFVTKHIDGQILDQRLVELGNDVRRNFKDDIKHTIEALEADLSVMRAYSPPKSATTTDEISVKYLRDRLLCPSVSDDENTITTSANRLARLLTTFLVDESGVMKVCNRYRRNSSHKLDLSFRDYFKTPHMSEAKARTKDGWERSVVFLDRIDSIVQGTKEIVLSFAVRERYDNGYLSLGEITAKASPEKVKTAIARLQSADGIVLLPRFEKGRISDAGESPEEMTMKAREEPVAVAIARLQSVDNVILPPHFDYAIIDRSGGTVFHSDEDRVQVSNFIDDTGNDPAIRTAIEFGNIDVLDAIYDGIPIRAHISPFYKSYDTTWTLVIFRSHGLIDRISSLTTSLALLSWIAVLLLVIFAIMLSIKIRRLLGFSAMRASTILTLVCYQVAISAFALSILALILYDTFSVIAAILLPFVIVGVTLVCSWRNIGTEDEQGNVPQRSKIGATAALAAILFSVAVVPMLGWQSYFRTELSRGLVEYLKTTYADSIRQKETKFRSYVSELRDERQHHDDVCGFLRDSVAGYEREKRGERIRNVCTNELAQCGQAQQAPVCDFRPAKSKWSFGFLWSLVSYSSFSHAIIWHRSNVDESYDVVRSPTHALDEVVGRLVGDGYSEANNSDDSRDMDVAVNTILVWLTSAGCAIAFLSICYAVARTRFGHAERMALLPWWRPSEFIEAHETPVRMLLVRQSEEAFRDLIRKFNKEWHVKVARWDDVTSSWMSDDDGGVGGACSTQCTIYVVEDFRGAIQGKGIDKLTRKLRKISPNESVILCSDIVPAYHMEPGTLDDPDNILPPAAGGLRALLRDFDVGVLCSDDAKSWSEKSSSSYEDVMKAEAMANVDLKHIADEVAHRMTKNMKETKGMRSKLMEKKSNRNWYSDARLRDKALRQFRARAQPTFKAQWAASSFDERLQLMALARGGNTNIRQSAAVSSLANRGLITTTDPLQLRSEAFRQFIMDDVADDTLDSWRRQGHHDWWRVTWLPLVVLAVLGLLFFLSSNPEAVGTLAAVGAASIGLIPVIMSLLRMGQTFQSTGTDAPTNPT